MANATKIVLIFFKILIKEDLVCIHLPWCNELFRFHSSLELRLLPQFLDHRESMTSNGYIILCLGKHIWLFKCKCITKISTCKTGGPNKSNWRKYSTESCVVKFLLDLGKHFLSSLCSLTPFIFWNICIIYGVLSFVAA